MRYIRSCGLLMLALITGACLAEDTAAPAKFYKLDFVVKEVEGTKVLNTRSYSFLTSTPITSGCQIRTGNKVPVAGGGYLDVGVSIDCYEVKETQMGLSLGSRRHQQHPGGITSTGEWTSNPPEQVEVSCRRAAQETNGDIFL